MKPTQLDRTVRLNHSISLVHHNYPHFLKVWHFHPELELVYIKKSTGTKFIGDSIRKFQEGDLVLVGENLPHMWQNDAKYFRGDKDCFAEALVVHFKRDFAGPDFLKIPEMLIINDFLEKAKRGFYFKGKMQYVTHDILCEMNEADDFDRLILFIKLLKLLAEDPEKKFISNIGFVNSFKKPENRKIDKVYELILSNFKEEVSLEKAANLIDMNVTAFCRYFKKTTGKTFSMYLNEVRIGYACKLLIEHRYNISEICYESGFNNISNFNRQFKNIMNVSPSSYSKLYNSLASDSL